MLSRTQDFSPFFASVFRSDALCPSYLLVEEAPTFTTHRKIASLFLSRLPECQTQFGSERKLTLDRVTCIESEVGQLRAGMSRLFVSGSVHGWRCSLMLQIPGQAIVNESSSCHNLSGHLDQTEARRCRGFLCDNSAAGRGNLLWHAFAD